MEVSKIATVVLALGALLSLFAIVTCYAQEVSVACMMAYDEGGAPAVYSSQECPQWEWVGPIHAPQTHPTVNCEFAAATIQGRRNYQEDRIVCNPDMKIPFLGNDGKEEEVKIGIAAVFDGHGGAEASELASNKFLDYFFLNVLFNVYKQAFHRDKENDGAKDQLTATDSASSREISSSSLIDDTSLYSILKEALIRTFADIDSEYTQEALKNGYNSGSTGTVALLVNGQTLVGFVGDSKAILCTGVAQGAKGTSVRARYAEELTIDHHPDREDEKARIEASGGFIRILGVPRVNGILAMTRAIGDLSLRKYGVIAEPEVIGWRTLTSDNSFLVLGSDGIFEELTPTNVCAILHNNACTRGNTSSISSSSCLAPSELANHVVNTAFENGSNDNISIVVILLETTAHSSQ